MGTGAAEGNIAVGVGTASGRGVAERARRAASAALEQVGMLPPALALLTSRDGSDAGETLRGAREVLRSCPLVGCASDAGGAPALFEADGATKVVLLASPYLRAKIGYGAPGEAEAIEAFRGSYIGTAPPQAGGERERELFSWYLYRKPSLVIAIVLSPPAERQAKEARVNSFLRKRFEGRVPYLVLSHASEPGRAAFFADDRTVEYGVILATVKTDLRIGLERFHGFEPLGPKLFITRSEGNRILEFGGRPAAEAYRNAAGAGGDAFALYPLAYRSRDGRYHVLLPEGIEEDGSIVMPARPDPDHAVHVMAAVSSAELLRSGARPAPDPGSGGAAAVGVYLWNRALRDVQSVIPHESGGPSAHLVEVPCARAVPGQLSPSDWDGESGHVLIRVENALDPIAHAAVENERLLGEVMRLKDLNQLIFDGIGHGLALVGEEGRILHCNDTYRELVGPLTRRDGSEFCSHAAADAACSPCTALEALARQDFCTREICLGTDGDPAWIRIDAFPLRDQSGRAGAVVEVVRDITGFRALSRSLEVERKKMEAVVRGIAETLYIVGPDYDVQFLHPGSFPLPGDAEGPSGRRCHELLFARPQPCPWCRMPETLSTGAIARRIAHVACDSGEERAYQITFSPWSDGQGETVAAVCLLVDISSKHRMERQLIRSEKLNSLAILSAGMAHELNNPLGAINFNIEILKRREREREYQDILESIRKDVLRINRIVGGLLSFSRSSASASSWVGLGDVIDGALELFRVVLDRRKVIVAREFAADAPPIWGNAQDLQQVFINLFSNAIDAMPAGGRLAVTISGRADDTPEDDRPEPRRVVVVYDSAGDLPALRRIADEPAWSVSFLRGDDNAIDHLRARSGSPPDVVVLDYSSAGEDRASFFRLMLDEVAPVARVLLVADPASAEPGRRTGSPAVDRVLPRPIDPARLLAAMRELAASRDEAAPRPASAVRVTVSDTGVGVPREVQDRIFDPFFTTKSEGQGTGLGLSVVHKILDNHGASIRVQSVAGKGTTFRLAFPTSPDVTPGQGFSVGPQTPGLSAR